MEKKFWRSLGEYNNGNEKEDREKEDIHEDAITKLFDGQTEHTSSNRRDFLKLFGFSLTTATVISSCEKPIHKAIPFFTRPEEVIPGKANYYASTYFDGDDYASVLVKVRDGRPIKIEGNELSPINKGGTSARIQASVLNLYDSARYSGPVSRGKEISWDDADKSILKKLGELKAEEQPIVLLTSTVISPSCKRVIEEFTGMYPNTRHVQYDAISYHGMLEANAACFGKRLIPTYHFNKANVIVSFGADFLANWLSPVEYARQYASTRRVSGENKEMSFHVQVETPLTVTGSNADLRVPIKPSEEMVVLTNIYNSLAIENGFPPVDAPATSVNIENILNELKENKGKSLVIAGSNNPDIQVLVNSINYMLNNYGNTIDINNPQYTKAGNDEDFLSLLDKQSTPGAIFMYNVDPVYDHPSGGDFKQLLKSTSLVVSLNGSPRESDTFAHYICPDSHFLESWNDAKPREDHYSLAQPTIPRLTNSRPFAESLLKWAGNPTNYHDYIKATWEGDIYKLAKTNLSFKSFWNQTLQKGILITTHEKGGAVNFDKNAPGNIRLEKPPTNGLEVVITESVALGSGWAANNPWLQELPDPIGKVAWDNYLAISPRWAEENGLVTGDVVLVKNHFEIPVLVQAGQSYGTASIALGYGKIKNGKVADGVGQNAYKLVSVNEKGRRVYTNNIEVEQTGKKHEFALTQTHHSMEGRAIVREATLSEYRENEYAGNEMHVEFEKHHHTLYPETKFDGFHWAMAVDYNACTGCNTCVIACQAENNIPVVGKDEVRNRRIMHWIRIDRYFGGTPENPSVYHQPVMCQHCDNAPCENVCPVSATNHSNEGINQMSYNRCIGTKYCINNCPYRVRRFNWFKYVQNHAFDFNMNSDKGRLTLNPDVVVRERGVVEKCSFCVQRIQEKKLEAKMENRPLKDGEIQPACVQACPSNALVFGDLKDPNSRVSKLFNESRNYHLLEEIHTLPSVGYLTKIRNNKT